MTVSLTAVCISQPFPFLTHPSKPLPSGNHPNVLCIYKFLSLYLNIHFVFRFSVEVKSSDICLSLSDLLHLT